MLGCTKVLNLVYDNCDFKFGVSQPTDLNDHTFESITTGLFFDAHQSVLPEHLEYADAIWECHPNNEDSRNLLPPMTSVDVLPSHSAIQKLIDHCQWHIKVVLVEEYFPEFKSKLGNPQSMFLLDAEKTSYSTAEAMYAKASMTDGNIEALTSLLQQSGIVDEGIFEKYMILIHGDLGSLEKIEMILDSQCIEEGIMEHMHYLLPILGLFHVRMACVDAINRIHASGNNLRTDPNGLYKRLTHLYPNDISKLQKKVPPFRMMNDGIGYVTQAVILDAWAENVGGDLVQYMDSKPGWDDVKWWAKDITINYFETKGNSNDWH